MTKLCDSRRNAFRQEYHISAKISKGVCVLDFFFPSRRRHTRVDCDWSSDVCSSDLAIRSEQIREDRDKPVAQIGNPPVPDVEIDHGQELAVAPGIGDERRAARVRDGYRSRRSEERRVGKECRSRWSPYH